MDKYEPQVSDCRLPNPLDCPYHGAEVRAIWAFQNENLDEAYRQLSIRRDNKAYALKEKKTLTRLSLASQKAKKEGKVDFSNLSYEEKVAYLEDLILKKNVQFSRATPEQQYIDKAIHLVARYTPQETLYDILILDEDYKSNYYFFRDNVFATTVREVLAAWQDVDYLKAAPQNLLALPENEKDWRADLDRKLAILLAEGGEVVRDREDVYSWQDRSYRRSPDNGRGNWKEYRVEAILEVKEDSWGEFEGTFAEGSSHYGLIGVGLLSDGTVRNLRLETDLSEVLQQVTR